MRAIALGLLVTSFSSYAACPNLAGTYASCRSVTGNTAGSTNLVVTQIIKGGATEYTMVSTDAETQERESETYRADGKTNVRSEKDPETGMVLALATTVNCIGNLVNAKMVLTYGNDTISDINTTVSKVGNKLIQVAKGSNMGEPVDETVECQ